LAYADRHTSAEKRELARSAPATAQAPVAVVDIGSNSVRLVVYEGALRAALALHNEKTICAIGRNMVRTGKLHEGGTEMALVALARFRVLAQGFGVRTLDAVATAAARDASNGAEFVAKAESALGAPIRILSGGEEARIAAEGVVAGIPEADGLVADLGGGSLDMVTVQHAKTGPAISLPFGPLRLMDMADGNLKKARSAVVEELEKAKLGDLKGRALYAVGGIWRALARLDMDYENYPLHVLHQYTMPASRALKLCRVVSGLSKKTLERMPSVPKRRAEALPYGALVLDQMIQTFGLKEVVVSAYGLREGLLQRLLSAEEAAKDPLTEFAREVNARESRVPTHADELFAWMTPLFPKETATERRVRRAVCYFADMGWRRHPDDRASGVFQEVLRGAYAAADHHERVLMATAVYYRYAGEDEFPEETNVGGLLGPERAVLALRIGLAARLAFGLSGAIAGQLSAMPLHLTAQTLALEVPAKRQAVLADTAMKRLNDLAEAFGRRPQTVIV
jgi:exopolyphosphatase/guanosine-5'-triphosphate,3'-diphosphate pyrophosphatase